MEVQQTNFVTHLIIKVQSYYWLSKNPSVKIWSNKFQMVMINYSKLCVSLWENLMSEFYVILIVHVAMETTKNVTFYLSVKILHQYIYHLPK